MKRMFGGADCSACSIDATTPPSTGASRTRFQPLQTVALAQRLASLYFRHNGITNFIASPWRECDS
jgi:hypothetical protein